MLYGRNRSLFVFAGRGKGYDRPMDPQTQILAQILAPARPTAIVDVGANPIDGDPPYKAMLAAGLCDVVGFEPQADALAKLEKMAGPRERYLPYVLGDGTAQTLNVCNLGGMTSLLVPDPAHLALFNLFPTWGTVKEQIPVTTRRLDDIAEVAEMDFLKMDVQGAERDVLAHGRGKLKAAVAVQMEVSFISLYQGQPTLGEMDLSRHAEALYESNSRGEDPMEKIVKGMVQVAGTTYRIVRVKRGHYNVVRVLDDAPVGSFVSGPQVQVAADSIDLTLMREIARVAIQGAKTSWVGRSFLG